MSRATKILVIRFSAMGDVAMVAPVLKEFKKSYPNAELLVVSRPVFKPFFNGISNLTFHSFDPKLKHSGLLGLIKLFLELRKENITAVADLHSNLRSLVLKALFFITGLKVRSLNKGRNEKKLLTRKTGKVLVPLKLTVQRYAEVFERLGFPFVLDNRLSPIKSKLSDKQKHIGISPFAQHLQKVYPLHKMEKVAVALASYGHLVHIFGGTQEELVIAESWAEKHQNIFSMVKKLDLQDELEFISNLDVMLTMDSLGTHLASLVNVPVVSVWGATHPYAGFLGYGQSINNVVQTDLYCRPCSVYGNVPCYRGDFACMNDISEFTIVEAVLKQLNNEKTTIS